MARVTSSQTVGPFFSNALLSAEWPNLVRRETRGERITIEGRVLDGERQPVSDAMIEIWQANADGRYDHPEDTREKLRDPHFNGFGRTGTDEHGVFRFATIMPGAVPDTAGSLQAPHISVTVFARGLLRHLYTRIYFAGQPLNNSDLWLNAVPQARRATLMAQSVADSTHRFDIVLQGEDETVFFDV